MTTSPTTIAFGRLLRRLREARGVSQGQLSREAGLNRAHVSVIEQGRGASLETLVKLARALEMTPAELLSKLKI